MEKVTPEVAQVAHSLLRTALAGDKNVRLRVSTGSMRPEIDPGDAIVLKACVWSELQAGDIIAVERDGMLVVHRFLRMKQIGSMPHLVTKGDAAWHFDSPVSAGQLVGRVERIESGGHVQSLTGGRYRFRARLKAAASTMKAYLGQVHRTLTHRMLTALLLGATLAMLLISTASAAVSVSAFKATGTTGQITLEWNTVMELKNFGFNIERSTTPNDLASWTKIAFVQSQSPCFQSMTPLVYSYTDSNLSVGAKYYYRLQLNGAPCGDPNIYHEVVASASAGDVVATPTTPAATATPVPTNTPVPNATATAVSTATRTPAPTATAVRPSTSQPSTAPTATPEPSSPDPVATSAPLDPAPGTGADATATPVPAQNPDASTATPVPTLTIVAMVQPTEAASAPRTNPPAQRRPTPTEAPAPSLPSSGPSSTVIGAGLMVVVGMGMFGLLLLTVAGIVLWQYYLRR